MSYRAPTYGSGSRLATIVLVLAARPEGIDVRKLEDEFGVSGRTRMRYVRVLEDAFGGTLIRDGFTIRLHPDWRAQCGGPRRAA